MKNSFVIAFALVGTAALATAVEKVCQNTTTMSDEMKAKLMAAVEAQCAQVLTKVG